MGVALKMFYQNKREETFGYELADTISSKINRDSIRKMFIFLNSF
jgi:hypothetical protein